MKLIKFFVAAVLLTVAGNTFAKTNFETEDRHLTGFNAVNVAGSFDVYIKQGTTESVKVEAPADVIKNIITEVKNGALIIRTKDHFSFNNIFGNKKMVVYVTIKNCNAISLTGSGDVYFKEGIAANDLNLSLTGSGDVTGKIIAKNVNCSLTGSGDLRVSGRADNSKVTVTGSGDFSGRDLTTNTTVVFVGGSGDASVYATGTLKASVTGSGDVHYGGSPHNISKSTSGSGDISGS
ncbi:DUF2807 domain-containing protein [Mucilaginibacter sp. S1162]|uniref:DUF2807 domain-containing protein n=1 Tax=Mucilaginibacter humi TaxID=2732510 RepID=A0ABX1W3K4_9SPHI|nr:head GIN domain-containing protein [Mucilaginibacter humi]NNU34802.1 DUF2807 domain-containing protein [Mucilaginibacter humi]